MTVYEKLQEVQQKLNAPKNQYNSFGKYKYRNCEDIQEGVKPILNEVKAVLIVGDTLEHIGDRYYIRAVATFVDAETGDKIENTAFAREEESKKGMDSSQVTGATSSYARKYALNGLFCIDDVKDADTQDNTNKTTAQNKGQAPASQSQDASCVKIDANMIKTLNAECTRTGVTVAQLTSMCKVSKIEDMTVEMFKVMMNKFHVTPNKKGA